MDSNFISIRIFDKDINFLGEVDYFTSLFYISKWETYGEFQFNINTFNKELFQKGHIIMLGNDGTRTGTIEHIEVSQTDKEEITVKGFSLGYWLINRITVPPIGKSHHVFNTNAEDIIKQLVKVNVIDPVDKNRKIPNLTLEASKGRGIKLEFQTRYKILAEEITKLSKTSGLGWSIELDYRNRKLIFKVLEGKDLTTEQNINPPQIFSIDYDNIKRQNYLESNIGYKNMAYVAGQGEGENREIDFINNGLSGVDRRETFIDARDIEKGGNLIDRAKVKLAETPQISSFECEVDPKGYKNSWSLGDVVTTLNKKMNFIKHNRVLEVSEVWEESGYKVEPTFGTTIPTIIEKIKQATDTPLQENIQGPEGKPGDRGPQGYNINYKWDNTKLGIKREDESTYNYVDLKGAKGDIGATGAQGVQGLKGDTGATGPKGDTGATGPQGQKGEPGPQGIQGVQGPAGNGQSYVVFQELFKADKDQKIFEWKDGYVYPVGINAIAAYINGVRVSNKAFKEPAGNKIEFNSPLQEGTIVFIEAMQAVKDIQGPKGDRGPQGIAGPKGDIGLTGPQGIQGPKGDTGLTGPQGIQGAKGDRGLQGAQGIAGPKGDTGATGAQGIQGPKGDTGATGPKGDRGLQGVQGVQGPKGDTGATGAQGPPGKAGTEIIVSKGQPGGYVKGRVWIQLL